MWHLIAYYRKPWCIQRFFRTIPPLLKVYGAWISCRLHLIAFDRLESHTPFPCPTSQAINNFLRFQCLLFILNFNHQQDPISDNVCRDINVQREHYNGWPDSSVSKIVVSRLATYLCCTCLNHTSSMLAKKVLSGEKKNQYKTLRYAWVVWLSPDGMQWFTSISHLHGQELPWLSSWSKCIFRS